MSQELTVTELDPARVVEVARLHCEVFTRSPSGRLGPHYVQGLVRWFLAYDGAVVLAATDAGGAVVGYAFGAPAAYGVTLRRDLRGTAAGALMRRPWALFGPDVVTTMAGYVGQLWRIRRRSGAGGKATAPPVLPAPAAAPPSWSLVAIAVSPAHRRSSIGRRLLDEFEDRSRRLGAGELRLTVTVDNLAARRFYDRAGWESGPPRPDGTVSYAKRLADT